MTAPMQVGERLGRLRTVLSGDGGPSSLLVTSLVNIRYLSGFTGSAGMLLVTPDDAVLMTDGRYGTQAGEQLAAAGVAVAVEVYPAAGQAEAAGAVVRGAGVEAVRLEASHVSWARYRAFAERWFAGVELVASAGLVEGLRAVKDQGEVERVAEAARIADRALEEVRGLLVGGGEVTEAQLARALDFRMAELGASGPSFETIVAAGPNSAKPHHRPGDRPVGEGEPVVVDFGARFDGYCSDMTRTLWTASPGDAGMVRVVEAVLASQAAGVAAVGPGVACSEVDRACRSLLEREGLAEHFVHGTGHGVGLEVHEAPSVAASSGDTLQVGQLVTVEPGVYLPGVGGVRVEDTVVVTPDGCRILTSTPKDHP